MKLILSIMKMVTSTTTHLEAIGANGIIHMDMIQRLDMFMSLNYGVQMYRKNFKSNW